MKKYIFLRALLIFQACMMYAAGITNPGLAGLNETLITQRGRNSK